MFHHHHLRSGIVLAVALVALAPAAAASAQPLPPPAASQTHATPRVDQRSREATNAMAATIQAQGARVARELAALTANGSAVASIPPPTIVKISQREFLTDAMIGAGITLGLVLVLVGSSLYITHNRRTPPINPAH